MKILQHHVGSTVLRSILLVSAILLALEAFIVFANQFENVGEGDFTLWQAALYTGMVLPQQFYQFVPMLVLLGSLLGLGLLASQHELVVMRASGVSIRQIAWWEFKSVWLFILVIVLIGETLAPMAERWADVRRVVLRSGGQMVQTQQGVWLREKNEYIHIAQVTSKQVVKGITRYQFNASHRLEKIMYAKAARQEGNHWRLYDIQVTEFLPERIRSQSNADLEWKVHLNPNVLTVAMSDPGMMTLLQLGRYVYESKHNGMQVTRHEFWFWQRLLQPLTMTVMLLLALPFIMGPLRSSSMGLRIVIGLLLGFVFYFLNQFLGPFSVVYQWPPAVIAVLPTLLFGSIGIVLIKRL